MEISATEQWLQQRSPLGHAQICFIAGNTLCLSIHSAVSWIMTLFLPVHPFRCVHGPELWHRFLKPSCHFPNILEIYSCREGQRMTEIFLKTIFSQCLFFFFSEKDFFPYLPLNSKNFAAVYASVGAWVHASSATQGISPSRSSLSRWERVSMLLQWFHFCSDIVCVLRIALSCAPGVGEDDLANSIVLLFLFGLGFPRQGLTMLAGLELRDHPACPTVLLFFVSIVLCVNVWFFDYFMFDFWSFGLVSMTTLFFKKLLHCIYWCKQVVFKHAVCVFVCARVCACKCVEVSGQLSAVGSLCLPCGLWTWSSGCQVWVQMFEATAFLLS